MSAIADMSSSSFGIASGTRVASLDVTGPSDLLGGRHGSCLWCVIMSGAARHRDRWLPLLLAAFFVITLGSGAAWPAMGGGHGGGHGGGFGGGHPGGSFSGGRGFGDGHFGGRPFPHGHRGPGVFVFPYFYDPYYGYDPYYPGYPYAAYCDPYSPSYAPQYCYWDGS